MTQKPWYMPLSKVRLLLLLFHVTLGYRGFYPWMILSLSKQFNLQSYLEQGFGDLFLSLMMATVSIALAYPLYQNAYQALIRRPWFHLKVALTSLGLMLVSSMLMNYLAVTLSGQTNSFNQNEIIKVMSSMPLLIFIQALIFAPLLEELMFRGLFYGLLRNISKPLALTLSSLLFGLAHLSASLMAFQWTDLWFLPTYALLGFFLALAYERTHSIYTSMLVHFLNNLIGLYAIYASGLLS